MKIDEILTKINTSDFDAGLAELYGESAVSFQRTRYEKAVEGFKTVFPESAEKVSRSSLRPAEQRSAAITRITSTVECLPRQSTLTRLRSYLLMAKK